MDFLFFFGLEIFEILWQVSGKKFKNFDHRDLKQSLGPRRCHVQNLEKNLGITAQFGNFTKNKAASEHLLCCCISLFRLLRQNTTGWVA
jgi:hypothetical protein